MRVSETGNHAPNMIRTGDGVDLFVRDWGQGTPIMLLAGWAMCSDLWAPVMLRLNGAGFRTIAYDRRGHGRSSDPGVVDYNCLADDLAAVIEARHLTDLTIVAHSGAGGEALRYLTRHGRARLAHLVMVGTSLPAPMRSKSNPEGLDPAAFGEQRRQIADDLPGWIEENAHPFLAAEASPRIFDWLAAMVMGCSRRILVDLQRAIAEVDFRAELAALEVPMTVISGDLDASAPLDLCARRTAAIVPGAKLLIYEGAAHGLMLTHAARLAKDIARTRG